MRLKRQIGTLLVVLAVLGVVAGAVATQIAADCQGSQCINCLAGVCTNVPSSGYCDCTSWGKPPLPGSGCVAGGGSCTIVY